MKVFLKELNTIQLTILRYIIKIDILKHDKESNIKLAMKSDRFLI